jgi:hypothetical protein
MKLTILLSIVVGGCIARGQAPDCPPIAFQLTGNGTAPTGPPAYYDNRNTQCETWTVAYEVQGITGFTVAFQSSVGANAPTSFGAYTGTTVASSASFGTATIGLATFNNINTTSGTVNTPWLRINVSGATGAGVIRGVFYGYRTGATGGTGGGGGGGGGSGCPSPCPVVGVAPAGSPVSGDPVQVGGKVQNATTFEAIQLDASGNQMAVGPVPAGQAVGGNPLQVAGQDGTDVRSLKTDSSGDLSTFGIGLGTFTSGQAGVTASAANLGTATAKNVCVEALITNTITVYAGASGVTTSTGIPLNPGQGFCWQVANTNLIYVIASTTGASVGFSLTN